MAGGPSCEVKRFTSGRVLAGSFGLFRAIHARPETQRQSLCRKHLWALVGLVVVGRPCSSNLPPSATISSIAFAICCVDRRARRKVPGRVPVLTLGAGADGLWCGALLGAEGCPPRRRISSGVSSRR